MESKRKDEIQKLGTNQGAGGFGSGPVKNDGSVR